MWFSILVLNFTPHSRGNFLPELYRGFPRLQSCNSGAIDAGGARWGGSPPRWRRLLLPDVAGVPGITLDKPQSPLCVALLIDFVKPDDVIAGITSNGVPVLEADTGSSPRQCLNRGAPLVGFRFSDWTAHRFSPLGIGLGEVSFSPCPY